MSVVLCHCVLGLVDYVVTERIVREQFSAMGRKWSFTGGGGLWERFSSHKKKEWFEKNALYFPPFMCVGRALCFKGLQPS